MVDKSKFETEGYNLEITGKNLQITDSMQTYVLEKISNRIINEVKGVNRVVYDITQKPPGTIEYE